MIIIPSIDILNNECVRLLKKAKEIGIKENCPLIKGIIIGKAIYEQKVSIPDLIKSFQNP